MSYVLESAQEFDRLESQSAHHAYDYQTELKGLGLEPRARVLDAGCGSGVVARHLAERFQTAEVYGCDISQSRIAAAEKKSHNPRISFSVQDLTRLQYPDSLFDAVVLRYVLQHLPREAGAQALREIFRVLRPGGEIRVIDFDGFIINIFPQPPAVREILDRLRISGPVDFETGRKIPSLLETAGFRDLETKIELHDCCGDEVERSLIKARLENARGFLTDFLGDPGKTEAFIHEYLSQLAKPNTVYFQQKFLVSARKARSSEIVLVHSRRKNS